MIEDRVSGGENRKHERDLLGAGAELFPSHMSSDEDWSDEVDGGFDDMFVDDGPAEEAPSPASERAVEDEATRQRGPAAAWRGDALAALELSLHAERGALVDELERKAVAAGGSPAAARADAARALVSLLPVLENTENALSAAEQRQFVHALWWTLFAPNELIYSHGEVGESCSFVIEGTVVVRGEPWRVATPGTPEAVEGTGSVDYTRIYPGHHVGERSLLESGQTRNASILAGVDGAAVLMLNRGAFEKLLETSDGFKSTLEEMVRRVKKLREDRDKAKGSQTLARLIYVQKESKHSRTTTADTKKQSSSRSKPVVGGATSPPQPPPDATLPSDSMGMISEHEFAERMRVDNEAKAKAAGLGVGMVERINDYDVLREIGKGAFGKVYLCQMPRVGEESRKVYPGQDPAFEQFALKVVDKAEKQKSRLDAKKKRISSSSGEAVEEVSEGLLREIAVMSQLTQFSHPNIVNLVEVIDAADAPQVRRPPLSFPLCLRVRLAPLNPHAPLNRPNHRCFFPRSPLRMHHSPSTDGLHCRYR